MRINFNSFFGATCACRKILCAERDAPLCGASPLGNVRPEGACAERSESLSNESPAKRVSFDYLLIFFHADGQSRASIG